jgi:hypothetical protein
VSYGASEKCVAIVIVATAVKLVEFGQVYRRTPKNRRWASEWAAIMLEIGPRRAIRYHD